MTPTPNDLITDLDALTHELRRVAVGMVMTHDHPLHSDLIETADDLYSTAAALDALIAELVGSEE